MDIQIADPTGEYTTITKQSEYTHIIRHFEVTSSLVFFQGVLQEYMVTGADGQQYNLLIVYDYSESKKYLFYGKVCWKKN